MEFIFGAGKMSTVSEFEYGMLMKKYHSIYEWRKVKFTIFERNQTHIIPFYVRWQWFSAHGKAKKKKEYFNIDKINLVAWIWWHFTTAENGVELIVHAFSCFVRRVIYIYKTNVYKTHAQPHSFFCTPYINCVNAYKRCYNVNSMPSWHLFYTLFVFRYCCCLQENFFDYYSINIQSVKFYLLFCFCSFKTQGNNTQELSSKAFEEK